uniref:Uncharacterized protein n=1 Tax=Anopheles gambiae TaxID=7165 RepID=A0ABK8G5U3_ANOGA
MEVRYVQLFASAGSVLQKCSKLSEDTQIRNPQSKHTNPIHLVCTQRISCEGYWKAIKEVGMMLHRARKVPSNNTSKASCILLLASWRLISASII